MRLWGECIVCRRHVLWDGTKWKDPGRGSGTRHVCPTERPTCGAVMPGRGNWRTHGGSDGPRERCARKPGHAAEHRTAYALANASLRGWTARKADAFVDAKRADVWTIGP